ncbi:alpha-amylase family protein [Psychrosphaera sp. 1_MG-2023]|uniref:alpha-amylase family protein n=1 Tax=Psychrosphaera sp. 1_MG-2023 TaxID=3062643 RepID=UPI0026E232BB|nr:alpha-amylase family protein [Psychrosphaera sp. 1_MG-2023]MDO6721382.1 alpha-amylase family protein [Psychrosphaera sp. 1_MG-2023]
MNLSRQTQQCLSRIKQSSNFKALTNAKTDVFEQRLDQHFPKLFNLFLSIYDNQYDLYFHLEALVCELATSFKKRPVALHRSDNKRLNQPDWYRDEKMVGMAVYVDLVADDLKDLISKVPYYKELGITYLHLMPLYKSPEGDSDGGYAVSDYRQVDPKLGTSKDLKALSNALAKADINLVLDFVFNHTSDEHEWAINAKQGDENYQDYYFVFPDRNEPDEYDKTLREIFPSVRRGCFSFVEELQQWVWTTFNNFQWDLNYQNPSVFRAMTQEMLYLANLGCDVLRLDALAFVWKEQGTQCENLPKAHLLIQAFNVCTQIVCPGVVFKSEAIVHPDEVAKYIDKDECQTSYNPLLMALLWNSLATRETDLLELSLQRRFAIDDSCSWVNYARCHDDIGWTFDDGDAGELGINGYDHRAFLNQFYTGSFDGSFATGRGFQYNPENGDCRVCGSLASLCGLEDALATQDQLHIDHAIARICLLHGIILTIGGIPLLYQGDELAALNDYSYENDDKKQHDSRWVNRPKITNKMLTDAQKPGAPQNIVNNTIKNLISLRKNSPVIGLGHTDILPLGHSHLFAYRRTLNAHDDAVFVCNFSEFTQSVSLEKIDINPNEKLVENLTGQTYQHKPTMTLAPYQFMWLTKSALN